MLAVKPPISLFAQALGDAERWQAEFAPSDVAELLEQLEVRSWSEFVAGVRDRANHEGQDEAFVERSVVLSVGTQLLSALAHQPVSVGSTSSLGATRAVLLAQQIYDGYEHQTPQRLGLGRLRRALAQALEQPNSPRAVILAALMVCACQLHQHLDEDRVSE